jgi:radical SAM protein with 4Fe4S-binding SPASM domain
VAEPEKFTEKQAEDWVVEFNDWEVCDQTCFNLLDKTPYAYEKCFEWSRRDEEFVKRAGFALMARLAWVDKHRPDEDFEKFIDIYKPITDFYFVEDIVDGWPEFEEMVSISDKTIEAENWIWKSQKYKRCSFPLTMTMIHSNGDISPCPNDWKHSLYFGNAEKDSIFDLWNSSDWLEFQLMHLEQERKEIPFCRGCICSGYDSIDNVADEIAVNIRKYMATQDK